jgi:Zn-dependent protease
MNWTFPIGRLFGIPIRMHWLLAILMAGRIVGSWSEFGLWGLQWMTATMAILMFSILFHELAHCWMGIRLGGHAEKILLWPLGGLAYVGHTGPPADQIKISGVGPLSSFVLGGLCAGALVATGASWTWRWLDPWAPWWPYGLTTAQGFLLHAVKLNFMLGMFNLLIPAYPLDGGQMLHSFLLARYGAHRAAVSASSIAIPVGIAMAVWGVAREEFNLILIGVWIMLEAFQLRYLAKIGELESHPAFGNAPPEYAYMPGPEDRPRRPGWFARWRQRRAAARLRREAVADAALRERVDAVLDKVSREGIGRLSAEERRILDQASRRTRGD